MLKEIEQLMNAPKVRKPRPMHKKRFSADEWLGENLEYLVDNFAGGYVVIGDNVGLLYTDADGTPRQLAQRALKKYPKSSPLFFRVPHSEDFICALIVQ